MDDRPTTQDASHGTGPRAVAPIAPPRGRSRLPGDATGPVSPLLEPASGDAEQGSAPIGAYLMRQRALRGITIEELSTITRIPLRSLERLERGEFDGECDGFVRGFVRTVALALGLDPDDTIARMLQEPALGAWERHSAGRRTKQALVAAALVVTALTFVLVLQAGWSLLTGGAGSDAAREVIVWRDPVRTLAEASYVEVDPAGEIDPSRGDALPRAAALESARPSSSASR